MDQDKKVIRPFNLDETNVFIVDCYIHKLSKKIDKIRPEKRHIEAIKELLAKAKKRSGSKK